MTQTTQEDQSIPLSTAFKSNLAYEALSSDNNQILREIIRPLVKQFTNIEMKSS